MGHVYPRAIEMVRSGWVRVAPIVTHRFPLARSADAFALLDGYEDGVLKAMITLAS